MLLVAATVAVRVAGRLRRAARQRALSRWRPRLAAAIAGAAAAPVRVSNAQAIDVLGLFDQMARGVKGEARQRLAEHARACGLARAALGAVRSGDTRNRLLAIAALGEFGGEEAMDELIPLAADENPVLSLAAARAMIRIDAPRAVRAMLPMIIARRDWPLARLVAVLQRGRGEAIAGVLIEAIGQAPAAELPRLLTIARILPPQRLAPTLRRILREHRDAEILARTLKLLADPRDAPLLREFLKHAEWTVRLAAVRSLGRVAREEDLPLLVEALADPIWWVRQRAAEAIVRLPFFDDALRERLCAPAADRYARDAVQRALAERDRG